MPTTLVIFEGITFVVGLACFGLVRHRLIAAVLSLVVLPSAYLLIGVLFDERRDWVSPREYALFVIYGVPAVIAALGLVTAWKALGK